MNTIIINKILVHMIDFEHRKIHLSKDFAAINDTTHDYYHKKLEKALYSAQLKRLSVASLHELLLRGDQMLESEDNFKSQAKQITEKLFALGSQIEEMPNCNVLYADCYQDGVHVVAIVKLNYKYTDVSVVESDNVRITRKQVLPTQGQAIDEAIVINLEDRYISLIEKKYLINGRMDTYLNSEWIKGEETLTDRQKFNTMKRVANQLNEVHHVNENGVLPALKNEIVQAVMDNEPVKPMALVKKVLANDYQASEEAEVMLEDLGIKEDDVIKALPLTKTLQRCKIVTDTEIEISMNVEDYVNGTLTKIINDDGTTTFMIENVSEFIVK